jgi:outer membrane protein assembly factor BamB
MRRSFALMGLLVLSVRSGADDWPQWMGPKRDGVWAETGIIDQLPQNGLPKLWSTPIHAGYSGPSVAQGHVFVMDRKLSPKAKLPDNPFDDKTPVNGSERVICMNSLTGKTVWAHEYPCNYRVSYGTGPRCTPTVDGNLVFTLGTMGDLKCLETQTGQLRWDVNFCRDFSAMQQQWGFCGHPLVHGSLLIALVGAPDGLVMAFDKETGKPVWKALQPAEGGHAGYAPPTIIQHADKSLLLQFHPTGLSALEPETGKHLWTVPIKPKYEMSIMAPQLRGDLLFVAGAECSLLLELQKGKRPVELWRCDGRHQGLHPINMTPLLDDDCIFGVCTMGAMRGLDLRTGKRLWQTYQPVIDEDHSAEFRGLNSATAFLIRHEDRYMAFNERGTLHFLKLKSSGPSFLSHAKLLEPSSSSMGRKVLWSHPAFANKCIYVRNDRELACFSLAK